MSFLMNRSQVLHDFGFLDSDPNRIHCHLLFQDHGVFKMTMAQPWP